MNSRFVRRPRTIFWLLLLPLISLIAAGTVTAAEPAATRATAPARGAVDHPDAAPAKEPTGIISLRDSLAAALLNNPDLAAFAWEVRAREARAMQAKLLPNPELNTEFEDFGGSGRRHGWNRAQTTVSLAQLVELGGKRAKRYRLATLDKDLAGWDYETRRLAVLAGTTKAFIAVLATQERLALAEELFQLATRSVSTVAGTVKTGAVSPVEQSRAEVARVQVEVERAQLRHDLEAARAALAASWGARTVTFDRVRGDLENLAPPPALDVVLARIDGNPDLARWATELEQRQAALANEKVQRIPDVTVAIGGRQYAEDGTGALVAGFSLPLPLFNRNQGNVLEAQNRLDKGRAEQRAVSTVVRAELVTVFEALAASYDQASTLRVSAIPKARTVYDDAANAYSKGLFRYIEVLDAQRTLFELRGQYLQALAAYHSAAADIERLTGTPLRATDLEAVR